MPTNIFEEYALLETQEKEIKLKKEQLRPFIMEQMISKGEKKVETSVGSFSVNPLKKWTYPERIIKMEEDFKAEKAKTQSTGEATYVEEPSLRFTILKL